MPTVEARSHHCVEKSGALSIKAICRSWVAHLIENLRLQRKVRGGKIEFIGNVRVRLDRGVNCIECFLQPSVIEVCFGERSTNIGQSAKIVHPGSQAQRRLHIADGGVLVAELRFDPASRQIELRLLAIERCALETV